MLVSTSFSIPFWIFYSCCVLSDCLDGFVARALHQQSSTGAKLDSIADMVFIFSIAMVLILHIKLPMWLLLCALFIALLRFISYEIGFIKYHTYASLHTYANKATGALLCMAPILYCLVGLSITGIILCVVAFVSSIEEIAIIATSKELNRDCKSLVVNMGKNKHVKK
ncbi:putative CDP-alcohol phosphatidyltransferase [Lachnospiraceae bacterium KM106-2]|nr:putative CDP-alcohol phosphatidyltransferase [Lachnospiraceae bacterium KM106-2]